MAAAEPGRVSLTALCALFASTHSKPRLHTQAGVQHPLQDRQAFCSSLRIAATAQLAYPSWLPVVASCQRGRGRFTLQSDSRIAASASAQVAP